MTESTQAADKAPPETLRAVAELVSIMARLRDPQSGCPWDVQQNFASIAAYTVEEAYEVADAIERADMPGLRDELGDLLLQVVFHSRMAEELGEFGLGDVARAINDKMLRRHPHVFADQSFADVEAQTRAWEAGKREERLAAGDQDHSALAGIARGLPEWMRALKLQKRAAAVGFDWPNVAPVFAKLHEEIDELRAEFKAVEANDPGARERLQDELGDVMFVVTNLARHAKVDPSAALRGANAKFERRFRRMEALAAAQGQALEKLSLDQQDQLWDQAKAEEKALRSAAAEPGQDAAGQ